MCLRRRVPVPDRPICCEGCELTGYQEREVGYVPFRSDFLTDPSDFLCELTKFVDLCKADQRALHKRKLISTP